MRARAPIALLLGLLALPLGPLAAGAAGPTTEGDIEDVACEQKGPRRWCAIPFNGAVDRARVKDLRCKVKVTSTQPASIEVRACGEVVASKRGGTRGGATLVIPFTVKKLAQTCNKSDGGETPLEVAPKGSPGVKVTVELKDTKGRPCE
jgi:hypothetical protein